MDVTLIGSTRADDIVRDADILHLYKKAGFERFLMGMENTDEATLRSHQEGRHRPTTDREAIRLLRQHGILSMATWVAGFDEQTDRDFLQGLRQLLSYDPDQIHMLYATPHRWTPYFRLVADRRVIQTDQSKWDYKHQVLSMRHMPPWRVFLWVKLMEAVVQCRPKAACRVLFHPDAGLRHAMRWYTRMGRRVWPYEICTSCSRPPRQGRTHGRRVLGRAPGLRRRIHVGATGAGAGLELPPRKSVRTTRRHSRTWHWFAALF